MMNLQEKQSQQLDFEQEWSKIKGSNNLSEGGGGRNFIRQHPMAYLIKIGFLLWIDHD